MRFSFPPAPTLIVRPIFCTPSTFPPPKPDGYSAKMDEKEMGGGGFSVEVCSLSLESLWLNL